MRIVACLALVAVLAAGAMAFDASSTCDNSAANLYASPKVVYTNVIGTDMTLVLFANRNDSNYNYNFDWNSVVENAHGCSYATAEGAAPVSAGNWTVALQDNCVTYKYVANIAHAINYCGWSNLPGTNNVFSNQLRMIQVVSLGSEVYGVRPNNTQITYDKWSMTFASSVTVNSTNATVFGSAILLSAVTSQVFDTSMNKATVRLLTSVQGPYQVKSLALATTTGTAWNSAINTTTVPCTWSSAAPSAECQQFALIDFTLPGACVLSGTYTFTAALECQPGTGISCDSLNPNAANITFTLSSDNFCPRVVEIANMSAVMTLSATAATRDSYTAQADYTASATIFGGVQFTLEAGLALDNVDVTQAFIRSYCSGTCRPYVYIYDASDASNTDHAASRTGMNWQGGLTDVVLNDGTRTVETVGNNLNQYTFEFDLNPYSVSFDNNETSGNVNIQVTISFRLTYNDTTGQKIYRHLTTEVAGNSVGLTASGSGSMSSGSTTTTATSSESTVLGVSQGTVIVVGATFAAVIAVVVAAAVVASRRRTASRAYNKTQSSSELNLNMAATQGLGPVMATNNLRTIQSAYDASVQA